MRRRGDGADVVIGQHHAGRGLHMCREDDLGTDALDRLDHLVDRSRDPGSVPLVGHRAGAADRRLRRPRTRRRRSATSGRRTARCGRRGSAAPSPAAGRRLPWRRCRHPGRPRPSRRRRSCAGRRRCPASPRRSACDMWFSDRSVKTTEYSSSPSGSTSRRGRLTPADCHSLATRTVAIPSSGPAAPVPTAIRSGSCGCRPAPRVRSGAEPCRGAPAPDRLSG